MVKDKILVSVVTYNRKGLLKENIEALLKQTYNNFDIFVIDNNSIDGTREILESYSIKEEKLNFITLSENIGGAGGFNYAVKFAIEKGYDYVWLMDDDTIPEPYALESLVNKKNYLNSNFSYLASVVKWIDGDWCKMNRPKQKNLYENNVSNLQHGLMEIISTSFVACFVNLNKSKEYGLPIKDFFIYGDDVEYTERISKHNPAFLDLNSCVIHKMKQNLNDTHIEDKNRIPRLYYSYRNTFYIEKKRGFYRTIRYIVRYFYHFVKFLFTKYRFYKIYYMTKGMLKGLIFNPRIEYL